MLHIYVVDNIKYIVTQKTSQVQSLLIQQFIQKHNIEGQNQKYHTKISTKKMEIESIKTN